jgi:hypothetical protein
MNGLVAGLCPHRGVAPGDHPALEIGQRKADRTGADVDADQAAEPGVEFEEHGRPSAARRARPDFAQ